MNYRITMNFEGPDANIEDSRLGGYIYVDITADSIQDFRDVIQAMFVNAGATVNTIIENQANYL